MKNPQNLIVVSQDEYQKLQVQAEAFTLAGTIHAIDVLQAAKERMFRGFDRRVELEMALLKLCSPELDESVDAILRRLARLEKQPRAVIPEQAGGAAPSISRLPRYGKPKAPDKASGNQCGAGRLRGRTCRRGG